ncbi:MAG TPA: gamma-glutamyltransferase [Vicinamibacterales bacterium]|jgi:gamma-glutamyltranspeptidase/glutathione hydrolase|nr:gamma-glutamyltransferase [Vicinamibacterales bacterium]
MRQLIVAVAVVLVTVAQTVDRAASRAPVRAAKGMVGSTEQHASMVGLEILKKGGNAVDAAVAVGFALAVTYPEAGNIGGGGLMLIRFPDGRATAIDYREMAPGRAHRDMYLDEKGNPVAERSLIGPLAAGVPGSVAGLALAQKKYGRLTLAEIMAPAIELAEKGFVVSDALSESLSDERKLLQRFPETARIFLKNGEPYAPGDRLVQKDLAATLKSIATEGPDTFYRGRIADLLASEMSRSGGLITKEDLAAYQAIEREPLRGTYRGYGVLGMPPISSGGVALLQFLNILEGYQIGDLGHNSSAAIHVVSEAAKRVYADRSEWLGDPAFFRVPVAGLISKKYAERLRAGINLDKATPSSSIKPGAPSQFESDQTTHYSVVDADGLAVATTTTLNGGFGSGQVVAGAGFLLNNEMDDFSAKPGSPNMFGLIGGRVNEIAPRKRMLSSMTPTIVTKDDRAFLVLGSPGGSRIITTVLQVVLNVIDYGMNVQEAVDAPRFHHQWLPEEVRLERRGFPADVIRALEARGHKVEVGYNMGDVHAIMIDPKTGMRLGASDPRLDGRTVGY